MSIFNQIAPALTRPFVRRGQANAEAAAREFTLKPYYAVTEAPEAWNLTVQLPGVAREGLEFTAEENLINIRGRNNWHQPDGWAQLYRESFDAPYELVLEHSNDIDVEKIHAELKDGVLQVALPKTEAVKPRKISIN